MNNKLLYCLYTVLSLAFLCYCFWHSHPYEEEIAPEPVILSSDSIVPTETFSPISLHAKGACVMDCESSRILYGKNENEPRPMASTTKIMTCLLALEQGNLDDEVVFSQKACQMPKVHLGAKTGSRFRLKDLLYSLMLESHNDTAVAIAEHLGKSVEQFATFMNQKASELQLTNTHFVTPNGLDSPEHKSTPYDMCRLASYAIQNPQFIEIIQTSHATIHELQTGQSYSLTNKDAFLTSYPGALGIKTGFTGNAGYCFVGAARQGEKTLVSCVLASGWPPDKTWKWADTKTLMNYGFENYQITSLPIKNVNGIQLPVKDGIHKEVTLQATTEYQALTCVSDSIEIQYDLPSTLTAPLKKGETIGHIRVFINQNEVKKLPVTVTEHVSRICPLDYIKSLLDTLFSF